MVEGLIAFAFLVMVLIALAAWLDEPPRPDKRDLEVDRQWAEMQLEQLARDARARMYRATDEARREQRERGL